MANYKIEVFQDEPIVLTTISREYRIAEDMPKSEAELRVILDQATGPLFHIVDGTLLSVSVNDVVLAANLGARGEDPIWHHPNLRELIFVHPSTLVKLAAQGMNTVTFGNLDVRVFDTVDEALAYARSRLKQT